MSEKKEECGVSKNPSTNPIEVELSDYMEVLEEFRFAEMKLNELKRKLLDAKEVAIKKMVEQKRFDILSIDVSLLERD